MAENKVEYVLTLKDMFTSKIKDAEGAAKGLSLTMKDLAVVAGGALAAIGVTEFLKGSVEAFGESEKASAQLSASLESTGYAAGLTKEALDKQAESLMNLSTFDDDAITGAQSLLLTFTQIKGSIFNDAVPAITDLATKMGGDLQGATIQVGKALNDPIKGITALSRVGVSFTQSQKDVIKSLTESGDLAGAQKIILAELNKEFGGSAAAAAGTYTGQMEVLKHQFQNVKEEIGGLVMQLIIKLKPAMEAGINLFKNTVDFVKEHTTALKALGVTIGIIGGAWLLYQSYLKSVTLATTIMTAAQWALDAALNANPIGIVIGALAVLAGAIYYAWQKSETFRGVILGVWEVLKGFGNFVITYFKSVGEILAGVFTLNPEKIKEGLKGALGAYKDLASNIASNFSKGYDEGAIKVAKKAQDNKPNKAIKPDALATESGKAAKGIKTPKASEVTGQKVYTININIDSLIKEQNINTTMLKEGAGKIKDMVTEALLAAVNDSQIIAER